MDDDDVQSMIAELAELILQQGLSAEVREKAKNLSAKIGFDDLDELKHLFHNPPREAKIYDVSTHGLGGWLSACQFAAFELILNVGEPALPFLRQIAWGDYDWTQGNAIEIMIRLAAKGINRDEIIEEIKMNFPDIGYEAQLYAIEPLIPLLETDNDLKLVVDRMTECFAFAEIYKEVTASETDRTIGH